MCGCNPFYLLPIPRSSYLLSPRSRPSLPPLLITLPYSPLTFCLRSRVRDITPENFFIMYYIRDSRFVALLCRISHIFLISSSFLAMCNGCHLQQNDIHVMLCHKGEWCQTLLLYLVIVSVSLSLVVWTHAPMTRHSCLTLYSGCNRLPTWRENSKLGPRHGPSTNFGSLGESIVILTGNWSFCENPWPHCAWHNLLASYPSFAAQCRTNSHQ